MFARHGELYGLKTWDFGGGEGAERPEPLQNPRDAFDPAAIHRAGVRTRHDVVEHELVGTCVAILRACHEAGVWGTANPGALGATLAT